MSIITISLSERGRVRRRQAIADVALGLFLRRGFDAVTVAEIAAAAEVAEKTVYNYFGTKAELVFDAGDEVEDRLVRAIRERPAGRSALAAAGHALRQIAASVGTGQSPGTHEAFQRMVAGSPALRLHQLQVAARCEHAVAAALAGETGTDPRAPEPVVAGAAIVAALRVCVPGRSGAGRQQDLDAALALLESGLGGYAVRTTEER